MSDGQSIKKLVIKYCSLHVSPETIAERNAICVEIVEEQTRLERAVEDAVKRAETAEARVRVLEAELAETTASLASTTEAVEEYLSVRDMEERCAEGER